MATGRLRRAAWFGVSTLILLAMLLFADVDEVLSVFRAAELNYFVLALFFGLSTFLVFAFTWYRCFGMVGEDLSYIRSLRIYLAGEFLNSVTPVGQLGGEPFMAYIIRENSDMRYEEALSTVLSADIINAVPMITFVLAGFTYLIASGPVDGFIGRAAGAVLLAAAIGSFLVYSLWFRADKLESFIVSAFERFTAAMGRGEHHLGTVEDRMASMRKTLESIGADRYGLIFTALAAHLFFILGLGSLHFVMLALGVEVGLASLVFVVAFSGASNFVPTPGGAGAFEFAMALFLVMFAGVGVPVATAAAILYRAASYWPVMIIGYLSLLSLEGRN